MNASPAAELTIDRLFDSPALAGPVPTAARISADGSHVFYLQGAADDKNRLDLWEYDVRGRRSRRLLDSRDLLSQAAAPSVEEGARRERQRTAAQSGILEYALRADGRAVLIAFNGDLFYLDPQRPADGALRPIAPSSAAATDATISPRGGYLGYVRGQNLHIYDLAAAGERALTVDGGGAVKNAMAEFVAQEEMRRGTGYWWSPDERRIAFLRVDESPLRAMPRLQIEADEIAAIAERYPAAGGANVLIRLGVVELASGAVTWIDLGADPDIYVARVDWLPDGKRLAIQRESRDQRRLDLLFADVLHGQSRVVLTEASDSWIELNGELTFLTDSAEFLWASNRDGFTHLYLYDDLGRLRRRLTAGNWSVDDFGERAVKGVDERRRLVYFSANVGNPTRRALYAASLDTGDPAAPRRISQGDGIHLISMSADAGLFVDVFTSRAQPPQASLHRADGDLIATLQENRLEGGHPYAPYLDADCQPEFGTLAAADGQTLWYRLFKPPGFDAARRHPVIVEVYGGPGVARVRDEWCGASFTQVLVRAGFLVFQLDNRGSGSRGTDFQAPIRGCLGNVEVADQVAGARWLAKQPYVDGARIGVWGWSYGGYLSLMLMTKAAGIFRAGAAGAPVTDWTLYDTHYTERYLGRPQDNAVGYAASSVLPHARDLRGDLLLIHGMADDNVFPQHSLKLLRALQDGGKTFDLMLYPGAKHGLLRQKDGRHAYATLLRFFHAHLQA